MALWFSEFTWFLVGHTGNDSKQEKQLKYNQSQEHFLPINPLSFGL